MRLRVATHNMGDNGSAPRLGAIIGWTEANRSAVKGLARRKKNMKSRAPRKAPNGLAVSWDKRVFKAWKAKPVRWSRVHGGEAKFTPGRGFLILRGRINDGSRRGIKARVLVTHLINNAHGRVKRARRGDRVRLWFSVHNRIERKVRRWERKGFAVIAMGDWNRKEFDFLEPLIDTAQGRGAATYDRVFVSDDFTVRQRRRGKRHGSDHRSEIVKLSI